MEMSVEILSEVFTVKRQDFSCFSAVQRPTIFPLILKNYLHLGQTCHLCVMFTSVDIPASLSLRRTGQREEQPASTWLIPASLQLLHQLTKLMKSEIVGISLTR